MQVGDVGGQHGKGLRWKLLVVVVVGGGGGGGGGVSISIRARASASSSASASASTSASTTNWHHPRSDHITSQPRLQHHILGGFSHHS